MLSEKIENALNKQIHEELHAAYTYLGMSAYLETANLPGMSRWLRHQAQEETDHAMRLWKHNLQSQGRVHLTTLEAPCGEWDSPRAVFDDVLTHEEQESDWIHTLVDLAVAEHDYATGNVLQGLVREQVKQMADARRIVGMLEMIGDSGPGLFMLDRELGQRV